MSNSERQMTSDTTQTRARWYKPNDWPLFAKIALGTVAVVVLSLIVTTYINVSTLRAELRERIGTELGTQAHANISHLADTLSEQLSILRSIVLTDLVRDQTKAANIRFGDDEALIKSQLLTMDAQWQAADDDSQLVQSIVSPEINPLAAQLLEYTKAFPYHAEILLTDRHGGLLAATQRTSNYYQANEEWWEAAYSNGFGASYIGQPEYDASSMSIVLNMAFPILSDGQIIGMVRTIFRMDAVNLLVGQMEFGETGGATLINSKGIIIADSSTERLDKQVPLSWRPPETLEGATYWREAVDDQGDPILLAGARVEYEDQDTAIYSLDWILVMHQSQTEAYKPVANATRTGLLVMQVFALISGGLAFIMARGLVVPITNLIRVAQQMAAGDLSVRTRMERRDEIGDLGQAFDRMADEITATMNTMEQRVTEFHHRAVQLTTAAEVSRAASSILDPDELLNRAVELITDRFNLYYAGLFLVDEASKWAVLRAGSGEVGQHMLSQSHRLEVGSASMIGWCTANAQARIALDVGEEAVRFNNPLLPDTRSEMALPLVARGRVIGALSVQSVEEAAFTSEDVSVLQTMADQLANAIENARLFRQAQEGLEAERRAYGELSRQAWVRLARAQHGLGRRYDPQEILPPDGRWRDEMKSAAQRGETILSQSGSSNTAATPIKVRQRVVGVLDAHKPTSAGKWKTEEIAILEAMADQLGVALDSARLYQDTQHRAAREHLTSEITAQMRASLEMNTVLQTAVREIGEALNIAQVEVRLRPTATVKDGNGDGR